MITMLKLDISCIENCIGPDQLPSEKLVDQYLSFFFILLYMFGGKLSQKINKVSKFW